MDLVFGDVHGELPSGVHPLRKFAAKQFDGESSFDCPLLRRADGHLLHALLQFLCRVSVD